MCRTGWQHEAVSLTQVEGLIISNYNGSICFEYASSASLWLVYGFWWSLGEGGLRCGIVPAIAISCGAPGRAQTRMQDYTQVGSPPAAPYQAYPIPTTLEPT